MSQQVQRALLMIATISGGSAAAQLEAQAAEGPLVLEKLGVMYVGGREVALPSGRFGGTQIAEQAPVHYLIPPKDQREGKPPLIMIPGMGLTSYLYLSTPDGREGWAQIFARAGHAVYVLDEPNNAVSGFEVAKFTETEQTPRIMLWANEMTWRRWGFGPEPGVPAKNTRYPVQHIEQLYASMTPVMGGTRGGRFGGRGRGGRGGRGRGRAPAQRDPAAGSDNRATANPKVAALIQLLEKTGPAVLVLHSASGPTGFEATRQRRELVKAIVAVEVTGSPTDADDIREHFAKTQFIGVYGDHFDLRPMAGRHEASVTMAKQIRDADGNAEVLWLPQLGIAGNSHLLMQDNNNDDIARLFLRRLR